MTQCERLLAHLQQRPIDPMTAWAELGIYRLGARAWDLKQAGYPIKKQIITVGNRFGEDCHVAQYYLDKEEKKQ